MNNDLEKEVGKMEEDFPEYYDAKGFIDKNVLSVSLVMAGMGAFFESLDLMYAGACIYQSWMDN